jgi:hypothetical protein
LEAYVANAPGDDYDSEVPSGYDSWIDYWNKLRYPKNKKHASWCRNCGKKATDLNDGRIEGGHVEYCEEHKNGNWYRNKTKGIFITPLCTECNNPNNTKIFSVDDSDLIKIPVS